MKETKGIFYLFLPHFSTNYISVITRRHTLSHYPRALAKQFMFAVCFLQTNTLTTVLDAWMIFVECYLVTTLSVTLNVLFNITFLFQGNFSHPEKKVCPSLWFFAHWEHLRMSYTQTNCMLSLSTVCYPYNIFAVVFIFPLTYSFSVALCNILPLNDLATPVLWTFD